MTAQTTARARRTSLERGNRRTVGAGMAKANVYYLPLRSEARSREPEVCVIDMDKGIVLAHAKSRQKKVPGNLIMRDGLVVSQTATEILQP